MIRYFAVMLLIASSSLFVSAARLRSGGESIFSMFSHFNDHQEKEKTPKADTQAAKGNQTDPLALRMESWLNISTNKFWNNELYPPIHLPNGSETRILYDNKFFRLNYAYDNSTKDDNLPPYNISFWFRLSSKSIYYTSSKTDMNVLGAMLLDNIVDATPASDYGDQNTCFQVIDKETTGWKLCADTIENRNKWVCEIKSLKSISDYLCLKKADLKNETFKTEIDTLITQPIILIPLPSKTCNEDWNYLNKGNDWECSCSTGKEQSPIDLPPKDKAVLTAVKPFFQYEEAISKIDITSLDGQLRSSEFIKIKYLDNALRIYHNKFGKIVTMDGAIYSAEEIVFHTPAEHTVNGIRYDMEMQVIHYGQTKGDINKQVVFSVMFQKKPGIYNKFIDDVDFFNLPNPVTKEREISNNLFIPKVFYSSEDNDLPIMKPFSFYTYQGSLSFPPCTERTIIYVAADPIPISSTAIQMFQEALRVPDLEAGNGDIFVSNTSTENYRNIQNQNGRMIFFYDHIKFCGEELKNPQAIPKSVGHYEKVEKEITQYFFVNGDEPSGIPGSFVVPDTVAKGIDLK